MAFGGLGESSLGKLIVEIEADVQKLKKGLDDSTSQINKFSSGTKTSLAEVGKSFLSISAVIGTALVGALGAAIHQTVAYSDEIFKASKQTGLTTETLSKLKFVAEQTESSFEGVVQGIKIFSKNIFEAANGNDKLAATFQTLGIEIKDNNGDLITADAAFVQLADRFKNMTSETEKVALAMQLFGRSGAQLLPILNLGSEGIIKLTKRAEELGLVLTKDNAEAIDKFDDSMKELKAAVGGVSLIIGTAFIPVLTKMVEFIKTAVIPIIDNMKAAFAETGKVLRAQQITEAFSSTDPVLENARKQLVEVQERRNNLQKTSASSGGRGTAGQQQTVNNLLVEEERLQALIVQRMQAKNQEINGTADAEDEFKLKLEEESTDIDTLNSKELERHENKLSQITLEDEFQNKLGEQVDVVNQITAAEDILNQKRNEAALQQQQMTQDRIQNLFNEQNATVQFAQQVIQLGNNIQGAFTNALSGLISGELTAKQAAENLGKTLIKVISDFIAQQIIAQTIGKALQAIELAAVRLFAAAVGQAWAVPAALAATATAGGAAAAGGSAITGLIALVKGLAAAQFAKGTDNIPARLSPGEMVVPTTFADAIRRGKLSLSGPDGGGERFNSTQISFGDIAIHVDGNIDEGVGDSLVRRFGEEIDSRLRGAT